MPQGPGIAWKRHLPSPAQHTPRAVAKDLWCGDIGHSHIDGGWGAPLCSGHSSPLTSARAICLFYPLYWAVGSTMGRLFGTHLGPFLDTLSYFLMLSRQFRLTGTTFHRGSRFTSCHLAVLSAGLITVTQRQNSLMDVCPRAGEQVRSLPLPEFEPRVNWQSHPWWLPAVRYFILCQEIWWA